MSEQRDNQRVTPDGMPEGGMQIVPAGHQAQRPLPKTMGKVFGLGWCVVGGATMAVGTIVPCFFVGFGVAAASYGRDRKTRATCFVATIAAVCVACMVAYGGIDASSVIQCLASFAIACLVVDDKVSVTAESAIIGAAFLALLVSDVIGAQAAGTTVQAAMGALFDEASAQLATGAAQIAPGQIAQAKDLFMKLWPMCYMTAAALTVLVAHAGARFVMLGLAAPRRKRFYLSGFDAPLWAVALLAVGLVLVALGWIVPQAPPEVIVAGACAVMTARCYFLLQGIGVLAHLLDRTGMGRLTRALIILVALDLEVSFFVMSIWGLIDVWANFRRLDRVGTSAEEPPALTS